MRHTSQRKRPKSRNLNNAELESVEGGKIATSPHAISTTPGPEAGYPDNT